MKKIKGLLVVFVFLLLMPLTVFAENEKINVYIFKGEGCGYCAKALTFFESLDDEYKSYFNLVEKEVWNDEENASKMQEVASYLNESVSGVPYIIIGEKTFQGFTEEYKEDIKKAIKAGYENKDGSYKDVVAPIIGGASLPKKEDGSNSAVAIVVIVALIAGISFLIYMAREDTEVNDRTKNSSNSTSTKKTTTKKKSNKK